MKRAWIPYLCVSAAAGLGLALSAPAPHFEMTVLLSDGSVAAPNIDPNLVNPWGLAASATGPFWIANEGTGTSSVVRADGSMVIPDVSVPEDQSGHPTGLVFNGGGGFEVEAGGVSASSLFLFVTLDGRLMGWNPNVSAANALVAVDNRGTGSAYTGAALGTIGGRTFLYVANFGMGRIDRFDSDFVPAGDFTDLDVPENYSPFGMANIDGLLYVTFAERDPSTGEDVPGPGKGFIDVFTLDGEFVEQFASRGELNAPWGLVVAPGGFGRFSNKLLVGNFGDGRILGYNIHNGHFVGALEDEEGEAIVIEGIWGLLFGNGGDGGDPRDLYFTAGIDDETHGIFGEIELEHH
jgi:uncharacterized protein (TIGR03118 family)